MSNEGSIVLNELLGGICLLIGFLMWLSARTTRRWPTVAGKVLGTRITMSTRRNTTLYYVHVAYEYAVGGATYQSEHRLVGGEPAESEANAEQVAARYNAGATAWVFYNPANPAEAVLEHSGTNGVHWMIFGAVLIGLALLLRYRITTHAW